MKILQNRSTTTMPNRWRDCYIHGRRPETREGGSFTTLFIPISPHVVEERAYLFGGLSRDLHSSLSYLRTAASDSN